MSFKDESTRQQSLRKRFIKWLKWVLRRRWVFLACINGYRLLVHLRALFSDEA